MSNPMQSARRFLGRWKRRLLTGVCEEGGRAPESPFVRFAPPGHYYSPIPDEGAVERLAAGVAGMKGEAMIAGVDLREEEQREWVRRAVAEFGGLPLGEEGQEVKRYSGANPFFEYADAWSSYAMLRRYRPKRVVEIGSGYSSALMLDVSDDYLGGGTCFTFVEPYAERLYGLMSREDRERCEVVERPVQDVAMETFTRLGVNDMLFIDSSHVSKLGSDVNFLFHEVVPRLAAGVIVHVHDVLWPFEYPVEWLREGRAWNEAYLLRSFLQFNESFEILLYNAYLKERAPELFGGEMRGFLERPGGSFWMRKTR